MAAASASNTLVSYSLSINQDQPKEPKQPPAYYYYQMSPSAPCVDSPTSSSTLSEEKSKDQLQKSPLKEKPLVSVSIASSKFLSRCFCNTTKNELAQQEAEETTPKSIKSSVSSNGHATDFSASPDHHLCNSLTGHSIDHLNNSSGIAKPCGLNAWAPLPRSDAGRRNASFPVFSSSSFYTPEKLPTVPTESSQGCSVGHSSSSCYSCCYEQQQLSLLSNQHHNNRHHSEPHQSNNFYCYFYPHHHHHHTLPHYSHRHSLKVNNFSLYNQSPEVQVDCQSHRHVDQQRWTKTPEDTPDTLSVEYDNSSNEWEMALVGVGSDSDDDDDFIVVEDSDDQVAAAEIEGLSLSCCPSAVTGRQDEQQSATASDDDGAEHAVDNLRQRKLTSKILEEVAVERQSLASEINYNKTSGSDKTNTVLIFVYGTLKRGYCNHYNLETDGIKYFQNGMTIHPYVMYLDSTNRSRPCLTDGSSCPINELFDHRLELTANTAAGGSDGHRRSRSQSGATAATTRKQKKQQLQKVCPFCCFRQRQQDLAGLTTEEQQQQKIEGNQIMPRSASAKTLRELNGAAAEPQDDINNTDCISSATTRNSKHWGLPVQGELYFLDSSLLEALDRFERVPAHYVRRTIVVRGLTDQVNYNAEVYFNRTSSQRWSELLDGRFRLLRDYTMDHHRLYQPREGNKVGLYNSSSRRSMKV